MSAGDAVAHDHEVGAGVVGRGRGGEGVVQDGPTHVEAERGGVAGAHAGRRRREGEGGGEEIVVESYTVLILRRCNVAAVGR